MLYKRMSVALAIVLVLTLVLPLAGSAQSATTQSWTSSITYYTPDPSGGQLWIDYYYEAASGGTLAKSYGPIILAGHKAGSLFIGSAGLPSGFTSGSAVLRASVPIIATYVQFASGTAANEYGRLLYSGFSASDASTTYYIPTFLYQKFGSTSLMSVQNVESTNNTVQVRAYALGAASPTATKEYTLPPNAARILSPSDLGLAPGFNGSVVITSTTGGRVVASAQETDDAGRGAYAFEGVPSGASTVYMATMLCRAFGDQQNSYYAIQNAGSSAVAVTVDFYDTAGTKVASMPATSVGPGNKISVNPCDYGVAPGVSGSAVITATGGQIIAMGKVKSASGISTAFVGQSTGATKVAAPYIRWSANPSAEWRSYIAVMNVGSAPATNVVANYYDGNGNLAGSEHIATAANPLPPLIKRNTTPQSAGALDSSGNFGLSPYGGAVEITSDQPIVVVVRVQRDVSLGATTRFAEDYNGVPVP
jgi:hypothetical protein